MTATLDYIHEKRQRVAWADTAASHDCQGCKRGEDEASDLCFSEMFPLLSVYLV